MCQGVVKNKECVYLCVGRGGGGGEGGSILMAELIPVFSILLMPLSQNLQAVFLFFVQ